MELRLEPRKDRRYEHGLGSLTTTIDVLPDTNLRFQRRPPILILDPHGTALGNHIHRPRQIRRAPVLVHQVPHARHIGFRLVVDSTGWVALDEVLDDFDACEAQMLKLSGRHGVVWQEDTDVEKIGSSYSSERLDAEPIYVPGRTLSLLSAEPSNYGSWLFRIIPKLAVAHAIGLKDFKVTCWCPRPFQRQLLEFFGVQEHQIVDVVMTKTYAYDELFVPTNPNPEAYLNEMTLDFVQYALDRQKITRSRSRQIYISRVSHAHSRGCNNVRHFVDEETLLLRLERAGFEIIEPETMSIPQQIELFANAAMVVGASGAALFNTIFCEVGTIVFDIEAFPYWLHAHSNYFSSCGHNYVMAFGSADQTDKSGSHQRWTTDIDFIADYIIRLRDNLVMSPRKL